jgi:hypothetical protein
MLNIIIKPSDKPQQKYVAIIEDTKHISLDKLVLLILLSIKMRSAKIDTFHAIRK